MRSHENLQNQKNIVNRIPYFLSDQAKSLQGAGDRDRNGDRGGVRGHGQRRGQDQEQGQENDCAV